MLKRKEYKEIIVKIFYLNDCKYLNEIIKFISKNFDNITFLKQKYNFNIDNDKNWNLAIFYNIKSIDINHNFVNNYDKKNKIFIFISEEFNLLEMEDIYRKEFDFYIPVKNVPANLISLFLINNIKKQFLKKEINENIIMGNYVINKNERKFWKNSELINLSKYEFDILWLLMYEKKYLTQDEIYKKVWKTDDYDVTRLVTQYIFRIKQKIGKERILTLNNEGYKFKE